MRRCVAVHCLAAAALVAAAPSARAVAVHGLDHAPLGAATLTVTGSSLADRKLVVSNIGSSGEDGVELALPPVAGWMVNFGPSTDPAASPIIHRDLSLRALVSGVPTVLSTLTAGQSGPDCVVSATCPGALSMRITVWNGETLAYAAQHPPGTPVTLGGVVLNDGGTSSQLTARSKRCPECPFGHIVLMKREAVGPITVSGTLVVGTAVSFAFETPADPPVPTDLLIEAAVDGAGGGAGEMVVAGEGVCVDPPSGSGLIGVPLPVIVIEPGAVLLASPSGEISVAPDGSGEPIALDLNGLPPGIPWIDPLRGMQSASASLSEDYMTGAGPGTMSMQCTSDVDDGSGLGPSPVTDVVSWTRTTPTNFDWSLARGSLTVTGSVLVLSGGTLMSHATGPFTLSTDHPPVWLRAEALHGSAMMCMGFPAGTMATCNGSTSACDSMVFPLPSGSARNRGIRDIRLVHPPGTPPGTWRSFSGTLPGLVATDVGSGVTGVGGLGSYAKEEPKDTTKTKPRRREIRNLGSSGEDGVAIRMPGGGSGGGGGGGAGGSLEIALPTDNAITAHPVAVEFKEYPCAGLDCDFSSRIRVDGLHGAAATAQLDVEIPAHGVNPLYVEAGGAINPLYSGDLDGDGRLDLGATSPAGVVLDRIQAVRWTPREQSYALHFAAPVALTIRGAVIVTSDVTLWRNRGGGTEGGDAPQPEAVRLNGLPPGTPVIGNLAMEIADPAVQCAGPGVGAAGTTSTFNGHPIVPTWVEAWGDLRMIDLDGDGVLDLHNDNPFAFPGGVMATELRPRLRTKINVGGLLVKFELPTRDLSPDQTQVFLRLSGLQSPTTEAPIWDVTATTGGGSSSLAATLLEPGMDLVWSPRSNLVEQGTMNGAGPLVLTRSPSTFEFVGDLDGDGIPDLRCSGFPPGTEVMLGGVSYPCDEVIVHVTGATPVTEISDARVKVHGIHRGETLTGVRIAHIATPPPPLDAGGVPAAERFTMEAPAPNPFSATTAIAFAMGAGGHVRATVLDVSGREVARLADARFEAGPQRLNWDGRTAGGREAPAGLYFVRFERDGGEPAVARVARLR